MVNVLFVFSSCILICSQVYVWSILFDTKLNFKSIYLYISIFLMSFLAISNYIFVNAFLRMIVVMCLFFICNYLIYERKFFETVVNVIFSHFLLTLSDVISALFVIVLLKKNVSVLREDIFLTSCGNFLTSFIFLIMCRFSIIKIFYYKLLDVVSKIKYKYLIVVCLLMMISLNFLMAVIYYKVNFVFIFIINSFLIVIYSYIIYYSLNEKNKNIIVQAENDSLMDSLHQYEDMVDRQRVDNHENKNQLLIIKNMIKKNDKDVVKYIDTIVKDKKEDDEVLYTRVKTIPSGGLQGIIYQKMLTMKDDKILFSLDVSRDVRKIDMDSLSMDDNYKLCKIIGVFLDNAIEESRNIKDKCIMISLYIDENDLIIDISNRFNNEIDIDKIDDEGYTTKGDGHGYGLSLVKKIVAESNIFENERIVKKDIFKQIIKVKIKNT